jgi:hypothetical protein
MSRSGFRPGSYSLLPSLPSVQDFLALGRRRGRPSQHRDDCVDDQTEMEQKQTKETKNSKGSN